MKTGQQYKDSLRGRNIKVYLKGESLDSAALIDHPFIQGHVNSVAMTYDMAFDPKYEDLLTTTSHLRADWDHVMDLDLRAVFFCSQAAGRHMIAQKSGKIINISSALGLVAEKQVLPYLIAKAGVLHLTKGLAVEWAQHNIQVNAICPGYVITDINRDTLSQESVASGLLRKFPLRRFARSEEIAGAAVFLASDASGYMTGQPIVIDGGWTAM